MKTNPKAFTLFEIIIAMLVVGILSALAAPKVIDLVNEARRGDELNTVGNVRSGIALTYLGNVTRGITPQYPTNLDNAAIAKASSSNPLYNLVLQHGITKGWEKLQPLRYRGPTGQEYEYDPNTGTFEPVTSGGGEPPPPPPASFSVTFGGGGYGWDWADTVLRTSDGGYIIGGYINGGEDFYVVKTNSSGEFVWDMVYGGGGYEYLYAMQNTSDGGYIMAGYSDSYDPMGDMYIVKANSSGGVQWQMAYDGFGDFDEAYTVQQTSDGYIIGGITYSPTEGFVGYLVKLNSSGDMQWNQTYAQGDIQAIQQTTDGYTMITPTDVIGIDSSGTVQWDTTFASGGLSALNNTSDGGYVVVNLGDITKLGPSGNIEWTNTFGGGSSWVEGSYNYSSIQQTSDGGYITVGTIYPSWGSGDVHLVKLDSSGNTQWDSTFGGSGNDYGTSVQEVTNPDGQITGYIISATTPDAEGFGDYWLIKTDANGTVQ